MKRTKIIALIIAYIGLVLLQVLVFNRLNLNNYLFPQVFAFFILLIPSGWPVWSVLLISFFSGLGMDIFSFTPGVHAATATFLGYIRFFYLKYTLDPEDQSSYLIPLFVNSSKSRFVVYSLVFLLLYHFMLFTLQEFSFKHFSLILNQTFFSSIFSFVIILLIQWAFLQRSALTNGKQ